MCSSTVTGTWGFPGTVNSAFLKGKRAVLQAVREEFSWVPDADDVPGRCLLDLGEDRRLTTCLLRSGHEPTFCKQAFAGGSACSHATSPGYLHGF